MEAMVTPRKTDHTDREALRSLVAVIDAFRAIRPTMPMQYVTAFVLVAMEEGLGVGDYAKRAGVSMSVMSRHLLDIGHRDRYGGEGFGLVTARNNPAELRKNEVYLTAKGRALMHQIVRQMK